MKLAKATNDDAIRRIVTEKRILTVVQQARTVLLNVLGFCSAFLCIGLDDSGVMVVLK